MNAAVHNLGDLQDRLDPAHPSNPQAEEDAIDSVTVEALENSEAQKGVHNVYTPAIQSFPIPGHLGYGFLRGFDLDAQAWFVAADLAAALGYSHVPSMMRMLDDDEAAVHKVHSRSCTGFVQARDMNCVNESGLYHLILKSQRPEAKPFRRWITSEVLPTIARTGSYSDQQGQMHQHLGTATGGKLGLDTPAPAVEAAAPPANALLNGLFGALLPLLLPLLPALLAAVTAWLNRQSQPKALPQPDYMAEPWFLILQAVCTEHPRVDVARALGVSPPFLSQVLNGSGKYGRGEASTHKLAARVLGRFANLSARPARFAPPASTPNRRTTVTVEH